MPTAAVVRPPVAGEARSLRVVKAFRVHGGFRAASLRRYQNAAAFLLDGFSPKARGGTTVSLMIYVPDCDKTFRQAVTAGSKAVSECADQFWGDRMGKIEDPFGHVWSIATHIEDVPPDEMERRAAAWMQSMG